MPVKILGYSYEEYKSLRNIHKQMATAQNEPLPVYVKILAAFTCCMEVIIRSMYLFMSVFEIITLKVPHNTVLLRNCYWDLVYGIVTVGVAWLTDSHFGKLGVIFCGFSVVIFGIYLMALVHSLIGLLGGDSLFLTFIYYIGKVFIYTAFAVNPVNVVFLLEQYELTHNVNFVEFMCVQMVISRNIGEIFFGICAFIFGKNSYYPQVLMTIYATLLAIFLISLFSVKSKLINHHFKQKYIESIIECFMTYGYLTEKSIRKTRNKLILVRASSTRMSIAGTSIAPQKMNAAEMIEFILTHETIEHTNRLLHLFVFLSPFIIYFFIAKMIYITWITQGSGLPPLEFVMATRSVDMSIAALSIITILAFEYAIIPLCFKKETNYKMAIKYFTVGFLLLGGALVAVSGVQILTHSHKSFVDVGTLKIHNAMNVSSKVSSDFTGELTVTPGATQYVRNIYLSDEYGVCRGVIENKRLSWHKGISFQTIVAKKNDVIVYVITNNGDLVRVDDFEPNVNLTDKASMAQVLFINALYDSKEVTLVFKGHGMSGNTTFHNIKMPRIARQKVTYLEAGTYKVFSQNYKDVFKFNFKPKSYSHIISGDSIIKYDVELPTPVDPLWDIPAMTLYGMSTSIILIYYLRFIFVQSPPPIRIFTLAVMTFEIHIVNIMLAFCWSLRKLNFFKKDYFIFCGCYLTNMVLFMYVIVSTKLNKPYVGTTGRKYLLFFLNSFNNVYDRFDKKHLVL